MPDDNHEVSSSRRRFGRNLALAGALAVTAVTATAGKALALGRPGGPGGPGGPGRPTPSCFLRGTRILTPTGEVEVSQLRAGDLVVTRSGEAKAISRVESSTYSREAGERWSHELLPVKIRAGALAPSVPHTDLLVSQLHCLLLNGVLVRAGDLVNGTTIALADCSELDGLDYYHLELPAHDVVTAQGAACETKLNDDPSMPSSVPCAPVHRHGGRFGAAASRLRSAMSPFADRRRQLDIIRDRLEDRAQQLRAA